MTRVTPFAIALLTVQLLFMKRTMAFTRKHHGCHRTRHLFMGFPRVYQWSSMDDHQQGSIVSVDVSSNVAAVETWNWCQHFVVPHNLCPWAPASVQASGAVSIYLIHDNKVGGDGAFPAALRNVAQEFLASILDNGDTPATHDPHQAIALVVDVSDTWCHDFDAFYEYYQTVEDDFLDEFDNLMLAPFHPQWYYGGLEHDNALHLEKASPYPTMSIVAQDVIDQAGPTATQRIATNNEATLQQWDWNTWQRVYRDALKGKTTNSEESLP